MTPGNPTVSQAAARGDAFAAFAPCSARRLLVLGGIGLILVGMLFGDLFAVFVLHQNAVRTSESLAAAAHAALAGDSREVVTHFQNVGSFLENRGTKVDTHAHMIGFGYLALMLAILQPWISLGEKAKQRLAWCFILGAWLLPAGVFLIHYVGLAYSPLAAIGWASIFADFGGFLVLVATLGYLAGLWAHYRIPDRATVKDGLLSDRSTAGRMLFAGGAALVLLGFLHGSYYAAVNLYGHETADYVFLANMAQNAARGNAGAVDEALRGYGQLQGERAVNVAAHAHAVEFGLLAMLLSFFQPYVWLSDKAKRRWASTLLLGSLMLPVCVQFELRFGLVAGGLADAGGLLVILALLAMWVGVLRYTGSLDANSLPSLDRANR